LKVLKKAFHKAQNKIIQASRAAGVTGLDVPADVTGAMREIDRVEKSLISLKRRVTSESAKIKADQIVATGAKIVVTSCHNCVDGLADLIRHYKLGMEVTQLVNLVANALVIEPEVAVPVEEVVENASHV